MAGRRRRFGVGPTKLQLASLVAVVVFGVIALVTVLHPFTYRVNEAPWDAAEVAADGRSLLVTFTGVDPSYAVGDLCWQGYEATAADAGDHVEVTVHRLQSWSGKQYLQRSTCPTVGQPRTVRVELPAALGGRPVRDPKGGKERPVFDGAAAAEVTVLPDGATLASETTAPSRDGVVLTRTYALAHDAAASTSARLTVVQSAQPLTGTDQDTEARHVTVHDRTGRLAVVRGIASVEWQEGGGWLRVEAPLAAVSEDQLVEVAKGTRVPAAPRREG